MTTNKNKSRENKRQDRAATHSSNTKIQVANVEIRPITKSSRVDVIPSQILAPKTLLTLDWVELRIYSKGLTSAEDEIRRVYYIDFGE